MIPYWDGPLSFPNVNTIERETSRSHIIVPHTIRHHLNYYKDADTDFVNNSINSLYVDDYASSFESENEVFQSYKKLTSVFTQVGFNMRKWASNSSTPEKRIEKADNANEQVKCAFMKLQPDASLKKVLGLKWNQSSDMLLLDLSCVNSINVKERVKKRSVLSSIARFYDPLGLVSLAVVPVKGLFPEICH